MPHPFTYLLPVAALGLPGQWWVTATETMQLAKAKISQDDLISTASIINQKD